MAIRKKTATLTVGDFGYASDDLNFYGADQRWYGLHSVRVRHDEPKPFHVTVREVDLDDDLVETDGEILFHVVSPRDGLAYLPRVETHAESVDYTSGYPSDVTSEENGTLQVGTRYVRVDVDGATADGTIYVDVYLDTSGDQRF